MYRRSGFRFGRTMQSDNTGQQKPLAIGWLKHGTGMDGKGFSVFSWEKQPTDGERNSAIGFRHDARGPVPEEDQF